MIIESMIEYRQKSFGFYLLKLVRLRWLIFSTVFRRAKPLRKLLYLAFGLLILAAIFGTYLLTSYLLGLLNSPAIKESGINLDTLINSIPPLVISGTFMGILFVSFGLLLQALYLAMDMDFLLSAPIPIRAIFLAKLLQAILPNVILIIIFGLPVLFSLGVANGYNILYFIMACVVLVFLSLSAAGISSILVMAVVHFLPAKRVAEILTFVGAIFFMVCSQLGNLTGVSSGSLTPDQISRSTQVFSNLNTIWSPLAWGGRGLVDLGEGRWLSGLFFLVLTLVLAGSIFWLAINAAERLYYSGWSSIRVSIQLKKNHHSATHIARDRKLANIFGRILPPQVQAILYKDFISLRRDLRNTSRMVMPLIMGIVFMLMMLRAGGKPSSGMEKAPELFVNLMQSAEVYGSMLIPLFVGSTLILNLALISFSIEGKSYWIMRASPVSAQKQLIAKFLVAYLPSLILSWIFLFISVLVKGVPLSIVFYDLFVSALILAGLNGIMLSIGVRGANPYWDDPRHITTTLTDITGILVTIAYLLVAALFFVSPAIGLPLVGISAKVGQLIGLTVGGSVSLLFAVIPLALVKERVYRIGEDTER